MFNLQNSTKKLNELGGTDILRKYGQLSERLVQNNFLLPWPMAFYERNSGDISTKYDMMLITDRECTVLSPCNHHQPIPYGTQCVLVVTEVSSL